MGVGTFILSQKKRESLAVVFITLSVLQIIIGCGMTGTSIYVIITVAPILHAEKSEVNFVFAVTGIYGTHAIFHWIIGIHISQKCLKQASRRSTSNLFIFWTCMGTNTILQVLIISYFAKKMNRYISRSIKQSIVNGMNQYLQDASWKETIDKLQYDNECCGLTSYEDWHEVKWLTKYQVDVKSDIIKQFRTSNDVLTLPIIPWSCCKIDFPMQCLHDPVQQPEYSHIWVDEPNIATESINTKGCLDILRKPIDWVIKLFVVSSSFLCIIHVVIFIISRILYTSSRNAVLLGDPEGAAPGWVFGRGDCGYSGGKSVIDIMESRKFEKDTEEESEEINEKENPAMGLFHRRFPSFKSKKWKTEESVETKVDSESEDTPLLDSNEENISEITEEPPVRPARMKKSKTQKPTEEKNLKVGQKRKNDQEVLDINTNFTTSAPIERKKTHKLREPSSGEETGANSVIEEIKRLQQ